MNSEPLSKSRERLEGLQKQIAEIERKRDAAKSLSQKYKAEFLRIKDTGAKPITELLQTEAGWVITASALCGSGVGFILGHASLGMSGAIFGMLAGGVLLFASVARFIYNATLYDLATTREKGRQAVAEAKAQRQEAERLKELVPLAIERVDEAERAAEAERGIKLQGEAEAQKAAEVDTRKELPEKSLRVIQATDGTLADLPWEDKPPTQNQLRFARKLGIGLSGDESRGDLSSMIDLAIAEKNTAAQRSVVVVTNIHQHQSSSKGVAMLFSLIWPGIGQIYQGRVIAGLFFLFATPVGYLLLIFPGLFLHLICILDAALYRRR